MLGMKAPDPSTDAAGTAGADGGAARSVSASKRPLRLRYGVAIAAVAVAFALRMALFGTLETRLAFAFFLPAAMIAAWYGGLGPGLLAVVLGLLLGDYFFLPPHRALGPLGDAERTAVVFYAVTATLAVMLIDNLHGRIRALERKLKELRNGSKNTAGE